MSDATPPSIENEWQQVREKLLSHIGDTAFSTWIKPLRLSGREQDRIVLAVPTKFLREWIVSHYADLIRAYWQHVNPEIRSIVLIVKTENVANSPRQEPEHKPAPQRPAEKIQKFNQHSEPYEPKQFYREEPKTFPKVSGGDQLPSLGDLGSSLDTRSTFESFVVGKPNEFAVAAAERMAESPTPPFNPLFLYGGVGLGKTHLMHAIGHRARQVDPNRRVVYLSAEKFMYQFVRALRTKDTMGFKELFRSVDLLMVDDVQFISGKDSTQEEFFHTFNTLADRGRSIVISADRSPSDLSGLEERIRSRLAWGLVADIHPTTFELRLGILQAKSEQLGSNVRRDVMEFLASRITSNVRELEGALNNIVHSANLHGRPVTIEDAQNVLRDLLRANDRVVTIDEIQKAVVEYYSIKMSDMSSGRRARAVARPRQIAMYLAKKLTSRSLPEIGKKFGGRDHTTVMHAVKQIERLMEEDRNIGDDVGRLLRRLQH